MRTPQLAAAVALAALLAVGCTDDAPTTTATGAKPRATARPTATPAILPKGDASQPLGQVLGLDGKPAAGVTVRASGATQLTQVVRVPYALTATGLETTTDAKGYFSFDVSDEALNIEAVQTADVKALKLGVPTSTRDLVLQLAYTGSVAGKVAAKGVTNLEGVDVYIPGTSYAAKTDAAGAFSITAVPAGAYTVVGTKQGLGEGRVADVKVESRKAAQAGTIDLSAAIPTVTKVEPANGGPGATVTLTGSNFGAAKGVPFQVTFNGALVVQPKRVDDKSITVTVPPGATSGDLLVTVGGTNGNATPFQVIKSLALSPRPSILVLKTTQAFELKALDTADKPVVQPAVTWTTDATGTLKEGVLTAVTVGTCKVTVTSGSVTDAVTIQIASTAPTVSSLAPNEHFQEPIALVGDATGGVIFCDNAAQAIKRIAPDGGVTTIAGGTPGYLDGPGASAAFANPNGVALGIDGTLYVTEWEGCRVRKITKDGVVSTLAGSKNWPNDHHGYIEGANARFDNPKGVAVDTAGNVYVADWSNHAVRQITPAGVTTTYAGTGTAGDTDGPAATALFTNPAGVAIAPDGSLYVTDAGTGKLKRISRDRKVTTIALGLNKPLGIALNGTLIYVAEAGLNRVVEVGQAGVVNLIAGNGEAGYAEGIKLDARFNEPNDVAMIGPYLGVADRLNHRVRKLVL
ncbi:MAG: repeat containing protein [Cyanobacteria bacterium RYN_339]|nr:repeat containing protein [Cyanobacteria bacterium RYN_339]